MEKTEVVDQLMQKTLQYLESLESFTTKEVPIYVQELLDFKFFEALSGALIIPLIALPVIVICIILMVLANKEKLGDDSDDIGGGAYFVGVVAVAVLVIVGSIQGYKNSVKMYKIKNAPRVYMIDYIRGK